MAGQVTLMDAQLMYNISLCVCSNNHSKLKHYSFSLFLLHDMQDPDLWGRNRIILEFE